MRRVYQRIYSFVEKGNIVRMFSSKYTYEDAMQKLNTLQSNKTTIEQILKNIHAGKKCTNLEEMECYLLRTGVSLSLLDTLPVIHVAGTKGKGSTSAMCESILRHHGYKTGFYSSPHLVSVCERIRLEGKVVKKDKFTEYFQTVYQKLEDTKSYEGDMPKYFAFLTLLAFHVFLKEKVDVAIIEVGIGGIVDYTNILRKVPIVGITSLGLDHTSILGNTIEEIALAKAGIMKRGCVAYTIDQKPNAMNVLKNYAAEVKCNIHVVPDFKSYLLPKGVKAKLPVELEAYCTNASLAVQLAHAWMRHDKLTYTTTPKLYALSNGHRKSMYYEVESNVFSEENEVFVKDIPLQTVLGLRACKWPGRYQIIQADYANFYLDGAHTKESLEICSSWFKDNNKTQSKILIFSATGDRDAETLLNPLTEINFDKVYFVIPKAYKKTSDNNDNYSAVEQKDLVNRCQCNAMAWAKVNNLNPCNSKIFECLADALIEINQSYLSTYDKCSVLVTGSLHLVGAALSILDPNLNN